MLWFASVLLMTGVFALASASAETGQGSMGRHIGSAIVVMCLAQTGPGWLLNMLDIELPWFVLTLISGAATWLVSWPWARMIYDADSRQATTMATVCAVGSVLIDLFWRWAVS